MSRIIKLSLSLALLLLGSFATAADWPTYLQNNARIGGTTDKLSQDLALSWVYTAPAPPEMAWEGPRNTAIEGHLMRHRVAFDTSMDVAVVDGRVYLGSSVDHKVYCFDAKTGQTIWSFYTDGPIRLSPTVWREKVYIGSDDGFVYCLRGKDGSLVWKLRVGPEDDRLLSRGRMISRWPVRTSILIDDGIAFFGAGVFPHEMVYLCAADAATGSLLWRNDQISQTNAGRSDLTPQGYLLATKDLLFVPSGRSLPATFDRKTGKQIRKTMLSWRGNAGGVVGGVKALLADGQIYSAGAKHFVAMDQKTGSVGFAYIDGRQLTLSGDKGFVATGKQLIAMDRLKHAEATAERHKFNLEQYALMRKRRSMKSEDFKRQNDKLAEKIAELTKVGSLWSSECPNEAALIVTDSLVVTGGRNQVSAYDVESGKLVWEHKVDGEASGLAVAGGQLFVSTSQGKLYAFSEKSVAPSEAARFPARKVDSPYPNDNLTKMYESAAEQILEQSGARRGFCLVAGAEEGRLAFELAKRSKLRIYCIESDAEKVARARDALDRAGLHGVRITMVQGDPNNTPFSNYFANLVVSDTLLLTGKLPSDAATLARHVKPCGGMLCVGSPESAPARQKGLTKAKLDSIADSFGFETLRKTNNGEWATLTRNKLPGAGEWSHQYGDVANTSMSRDYRVRGGLGVLWYGDPGPSKMVNRHEAASAPLSTNGRMFIQGTDNIMCYDAYNGMFLWEYKNPGAIRTGVFNNEETSNLVASDDAFFVAVKDTCTMLDAATGEVLAEFKSPKSEDKIPRVWGYVGYYDGMLIGTSTIRKDLAASLKRRGHTVENATDALFAIDLKTGKQKWLYRGKNILHVTIALGDDGVYFIDSSISRDQREALLRQDKTELKKLGEEEAKKKEEELKKYDVRLAVALDANTGQQLWSKAVDVTDCSYVGIGGGNLTLMYHDNHVLICGANANGHYWRQFLSGQFSKRRLVVLDSNTGEKLWSKDGNYRHRPIIVENEIIAEPWGFDLHTGKEKMREHPITGEETVWQFSRPGHHCGMVTATPNMLFFRSGFSGYYDLYSDSGSSHFAGHRTGCWINMIPGNGLLMIPEASAGCVCQFSIASTVVLEPKEKRDTWKIYSATGASTPVKKISINLGAPGDRRDQFGTLWIGYPRPKTVGRLEYLFDIKPSFASGGGYYTESNETTSLQNADTPWIFTTGARGLTKCEVPLLGKDDPAANYIVKLHFADIHGGSVGQRVFDIKLQGAVAAENVDVVEETGGANKALVRTFEAVEVEGSLVVELVSKAGRPTQDQLPIISAIEVERQ